MLWVCQPRSAADRGDPDDDLHQGRTGRIGPMGPSRRPEFPPLAETHKAHATERELLLSFIILLPLERFRARWLGHESGPSREGKGH